MVDKRRVMRFSTRLTRSQDSVARLQLQEGLLSHATTERSGSGQVLTEASSEIRASPLTTYEELSVADVGSVTLLNKLCGVLFWTCELQAHIEELAEKSTEG